jgi:hypothetical protein
MANKYLDILSPCIDQYGFITQAGPQFDGGDSSQREGTLMLWSWCALQEGKLSQADYDVIQARYIANYAKLREGCMPGEITRHRGSAQWYDLPWRMSRDQWTPNAISAGLVKQNRADLLWGASLRGFLFTTNLIPNWVVKGQTGYEIKCPDLTVLSSWGYMARWAGWLALPLVLITDLDLLVNSIIWHYNIKNPANTNTDISNHVNSLLQAKYKCPTPFSWLARRILNVNDVQNLLNSYFGPGSCPLGQVSQDFLADSWK